ncbi:hypothetical protein PQD71_gp047 [Kosakonia phage Kc263]|uniref:Uncharacterized protein n=1 Tax=Kosakonia phage Kc263 TaxID=2863194 RepID=A0AAE8BEF7_9CAUD|nr:hypothetical protein PQD71_gp047 [Kosakonia phage Kc263]QYN79940.1 hypothetical protein [Kosakonia phage Kc263]
MDKHFELNRNGNNGWTLNRGEHQIQICRLKEEIQIGPVFKKEQCGVAFRYQDLRKDSVEESVTFSLSVIDPEHDNTEHSLVYMTRKMLEQIKLGTFGNEWSKYHSSAEFMEYVLKFLGEDPNVYLDKQIPIPMDTPDGKVWFVNVGEYRYRATRSYSMSSGYYATIIHCENVNFGLNKDLYKHRSATLMSKTALPLNYKDAVNAFK